jgi:hypothetical protein
MSEMLLISCQCRNLTPRLVKSNIDSVFLPNHYQTKTYWQSNYGTILCISNKSQLSRFIKMNYIPIIKVFCGFVSLSLQFSVQCFVDHCCLYVLFVWPLCILLRFMASNYSFGIFTLFFINNKLSIYWFSHARSQRGNLSM